MMGAMDWPLMECESKRQASTLPEEGAKVESAARREK